MATIGSFTKTENGTYTGTVRTLTVNAKTRIAPDADKAKDNCQSARNRDPVSASNRDPSLRLSWACPGSEQEGPTRVAPCPHERQSGTRGRYLFAHLGKPGVGSGEGFMRGF